MEARDHFLISVLVSSIASALVFPRITVLALVAAITGILAGVLIDFDHFIIARWKTGNWDYLTTSISDPVTAFARHKTILEDIETVVPSEERLLTHATLTAIAFTTLYFLSSETSLVVLASLTAHILSDIYYSYW
ncbi:MAG: hypothetical protein ABEJ99_04800 [Candidatus Nanohaloarchaea archaeon]